MNSRKIRRLAFVILLSLSASNCATNPHANAEELDASAFRRHFSSEDACGKDVESILRSAVRELSLLSTIGEMRNWLASHPTDTFAILAQRVGHASLQAGVIDPRREKDQMAVVSHILEELQRLPGFAQSQCGPDVRDHFMESLYFGLGRENAKVNRELAELNVTQPSEQRWTILVSLLAGNLSSTIY